ncbi:hypothetical protein L249_6894 [Ophiocordyceps polyrhachis-furcata BCC 54312]|uniref:NAD dependent epimerase/dehydratase n=1 Tax=Ophiocordyceps polyrhachis-furcata BCC 54312 TaxID=1330021 RepID=A0A367LJW4_9HYPO|nr:hypothetical protein L249_6894 [Ophiocordyceps polyrhachis-furcata BCC 54312]
MEADDSSVHPPLLVLGLSRTGGTSLSRALGLLGYERLYDLDDVANGEPDQAEFWLRAARRKLDGGEGFDRTEIKALLKGYDGVRNVPAAAFAAEFIRCFPDSKVILPTRDPESWHAYVSARRNKNREKPATDEPGPDRSCLTTVYRRASDPILRALALVDGGSRTYLTLLQSLQQTLYGGDFKHRGKSVLAEHEALLRERVPPTQLLEYRITEGWAPLCAFLGRRQPATDLPRSNDGDAFWRACRTRDARVAWRKGGEALPALLVLVAVVFWPVGAGAVALAVVMAVVSFTAAVNLLTS